MRLPRRRAQGGRQAIGAHAASLAIRRRSVRVTPHAVAATQDYRTPDEKKAIIGDRMRARAVMDSEAVADALLQTAAQEKLGPDWRAIVARDESLDEDAVTKFLLENCDVRWVDA